MDSFKQDYTLDAPTPSTMHSKQLYQWQDKDGLIRQQWITPEQLAHLNALFDKMNLEIDKAEKVVRDLFEPAILALQARF